MRSLSNQEIDDKEKFIFTNDVYCSIGRLTRQKLHRIVGRFS